MKSYIYKAGDIVNDWEILYKHDNKYKYFSGQKNYAYHVRCIKCGEERDLYGISAIKQNKCECRKVLKALKTLKEKYVNKIYEDHKILNFFYEKEKGIVCAYLNLETNKVIRKPFYANRLYIVENIMKQNKPLTLVEQCEKILKIKQFKIHNKIYESVLDIVKTFGVANYAVIRYIRKEDWEGLELYCLYTQHRKKKI